MKKTNFTRKDMLEMIKDFQEFADERFGKENLEDLIPSPRNIKAYDTTHITKDIITKFTKFFEKYKEPPFPKFVPEYVYTKEEFIIIKNNFEGNDYFKYRPIAGFEEMFAMEIYIGEE